MSSSEDDSKKIDFNKKELNLTNHDLTGRGLTGIINQGNTCYMNTMIQLLSNIPDLTLYFLNGLFRFDCNLERPPKEYEMCREYFRVLCGLWEEPKYKMTIIRPRSFKNVFAKHNPIFRGFRQHDCQEALSCLIDLLHTALAYGVEIESDGEIKNERDKLAVQSIKEWNGFYSKEYSKLVELLYGQDHTVLRCTDCGHQSHKFEPFNLLSVPIPNIESGELDIYDCLDEYTKDEKLTEGIFKCEKCKSTNITKNISLWRLPKYVIIAFKRFNLMMRKKNHFIRFPLLGLNLNKYISGYEDTEYDLIGVGNHTGGFGGGHYFAFCKNLDNKFYVYNDRMVRELEDLRHIVSPNAYVLVYKRRD